MTEQEFTEHLEFLARKGDLTEINTQLQKAEEENITPDRIPALIEASKQCRTYMGDNGLSLHAAQENAHAQIVRSLLNGLTVDDPSVFIDKLRSAENDDIFLLITQAAAYNGCEAATDAVVACWVKALPLAFSERDFIRSVTDIASTLLAAAENNQQNIVDSLLQRLTGEQVFGVFGSADIDHEAFCKILELFYTSNQPDLFKRLIDKPPKQIDRATAREILTDPIDFSNNLLTAFDNALDPQQQSVSIVDINRLQIDFKSAVRNGDIEQFTGLFDQAMAKSISLDLTSALLLAAEQHGQSFNTPQMTQDSDYIQIISVILTKLLEEPTRSEIDTNFSEIKIKIETTKPKDPIKQVIIEVAASNGHGHLASHLLDRWRWSLELQKNSVTEETRNDYNRSINNLVDTFSNAIFAARDHQSAIEKLTSSSRNILSPMTFSLEDIDKYYLVMFKRFSSIGHLEFVEKLLSADRRQDSFYQNALEEISDVPAYDSLSALLSKNLKRSQYTKTLEQAASKGDITSVTNALEQAATADIKLDSCSALQNAANYCAWETKNQRPLVFSNISDTPIAQVVSKLVKETSEEEIQNRGFSGEALNIVNLAAVYNGELGKTNFSGVSIYTFSPLKDFITLATNFASAVLTASNNIQAAEEQDTTIDTLLNKLKNPSFLETLPPEDVRFNFVYCKILDTFLKNNRQDLFERLMNNLPFQFNLEVISNHRLSFIAKGGINENLFEALNQTKQINPQEIALRDAAIDNDVNEINRILEEAQVADTSLNRTPALIIVAANLKRQMDMARTSTFVPDDHGPAAQILIHLLKDLEITSPNAFTSALRREGPQNMFGLYFLLAQAAAITNNAAITTAVLDDILRAKPGLDSIKEIVSQVATSFVQAKDQNFRESLLHYFDRFLEMPGYDFNKLKHALRTIAENADVDINVIHRLLNNPPADCSISSLRAFISANPQIEILIPEIAKREKINADLIKAAINGNTEEAAQLLTPSPPENIVPDRVAALIAILRSNADQLMLSRKPTNSLLLPIIKLLIKNLEVPQYKSDSADSSPLFNVLNDMKSLLQSNTVNLLLHAANEIGNQKMAERIKDYRDVVRDYPPKPRGTVSERFNLAIQLPQHQSIEDLIEEAREQEVSLDLTSAVTKLSIARCGLDERPSYLPPQGAYELDYTRENLQRLLAEVDFTKTPPAIFLSNLVVELKKSFTGHFGNNSEKNITTCLNEIMCAAAESAKWPLVNTILDTFEEMPERADYLSQSLHLVVSTAAQKRNEEIIGSLLQRMSGDSRYAERFFQFLLEFSFQKRIDFIDKLLQNLPPSFDFQRAIVQLSRDSAHNELVGKLLQHAPPSIRVNLQLVTISSNDEDIKKYPIEKTLQEVERIENEAQAQGITLNHTPALATAAVICNEKLRTKAIQLDKDNRQWEVLKRLMRGIEVNNPSQFIDEFRTMCGFNIPPEQINNTMAIAIQATTAVGNTSVNQALVKYLVRDRPNFSETLTDLDKLAAVQARSDWIRDISDLRPRIDSQLAPAVTDSIRLWLEREPSPGQSTEITIRNHDTIAKYGEFIQAADFDEKQSISAFSAFLMRAEGMKDFRDHPEIFKRRIRDIVEALVDKNHPFHDGTLSNESLLQLRQKIMAVSAAALDACVDRMEVGLKMLEDQIVFHRAERFTTMAEHDDLARKTYADYVFNKLAYLKAVELGVDGRTFRDSAGAMRLQHPGEQVELSAFFNSAVDAKYVLPHRSSGISYFNYIVHNEKIANPEKYKDLTNEEIRKKIHDDFKQQAETILEAQFQGAKNTTLENQIIASQKAFQRAARGFEGHKDDTMDFSMKSYENFFVEEYGPVKRYVDNKIPAIEALARDSVTQRERDYQELDEHLEVRPTPPKALKKPMLIEPSPLKPDADENEKLRHHMEDARFQRSQRTHRFDMQVWEKANEKYEKEILPAYQKQVKAWETKVTRLNGMTNLVLETRLETVREELHQFKKGAVPGVVRDIHRQYTNDKPVLDQFKAKQDGGYQCTWEPLDAHPKETNTLDRKVTDIDASGNVLLASEDKVPAIRLITTQRFNQLQGQPEDTMPAIGETVRLRWNDGGTLARIEPASRQVDAAQGPSTQKIHEPILPVLKQPAVAEPIKPTREEDELGIAPVEKEQAPATRPMGGRLHDENIAQSQPSGSSTESQSDPTGGVITAGTQQPGQSGKKKKNGEKKKLFTEATRKMFRATFRRFRRKDRDGDSGAGTGGGNITAGMAMVDHSLAHQQIFSDPTHPLYQGFDSTQQQSLDPALAKKVESIGKKLEADLNEREAIAKPSNPNLVTVRTIAEHLKLGGNFPLTTVPLCDGDGKTERNGMAFLQVFLSKDKPLKENGKFVIIQTDHAELANLNLQHPQQPVLINADGTIEAGPIPQDRKRRPSTSQSNQSSSSSSEPSTAKKKGRRS